MAKKTKEQKRIEDLLGLMQQFNNKIIMEIQSIHSGRMHTANDVYESLSYTLDEKMRYIVRMEKIG